VDAAPVVPGAQRRQVVEIIRAFVGPEHDLVSLEVAVGSRAAPAVVLEHGDLAYAVRGQYVRRPV
jgi:hypothetical protein